MNGALIRGGALIRQEIRFQWGQGIHALYLLFALLYIALLRVLPPAYRGPAAVGLLLSDPTMLGFFFSGIILFWERNLLPSLFVTPLRPGTYLFHRALSFLILSLLLSLVILTAAFGFRYRPGPVILGLILTAPFFTFFGMFLSFRFRDVISYLMAGGLLMTVFLLPLLELLPRWRIPLFLPTRASLFCFLHALDPGRTGFASPLDFLLTLLFSAGETWAAYLLCGRELKRFVAGRRNYD